MAGPHYLIVEFYNGDLFHAENSLFDAGYEQTVKAIAAGHHEHVCQVIEIGTGKDVTEQVLGDVLKAWGCVGNVLVLEPWQAAIVKQCTFERKAKLDFPAADYSEAA